MPTVKYDPSHHASATPEARIRHRLGNSGDVANAQHVVQTGNSPNRVFTNLHHSRVHTHGEVNPGEGNIYGQHRGPANPVKKGTL